MTDLMLNISIDHSNLCQCQSESQEFFSSINIVNVMPFHFYSLPWNQQTLLGYFGEICFSILMGESFLLFNSLILLFISISLHHQAFYKRFKHSLREIERPGEKRNNERFLCELVRFHITIRE